MDNSRINVREGAIWLGVSQAAKVAMQLASILILARILPSEDYGLMAMASTVTTFAALFRDMGTGVSLIQRQKLDDALCSTVFWFNLALGAAISICLVVLSQGISWLFSEPRLIYVLQAISPIFLISSASIVQFALFERASNFKVTASIETVSAAVALLSAIFAASSGFGVFALVIQSLVSGALSTLLLWLFSPWRPIWIFERQSLLQIHKFSTNMFIFNAANYLQRNADTALIGRFLGAVDLGFYNIAYRILLFPLQNITFILTRAALPAYSRNLERKDELRRHYLGTLSLIVFFSAPLMTIIWIARDLFIEVIFGERWLPSSAVLAWLAPVGLFQSMVSTSGTLLTAVGRADTLRNLGFIGIPFLVIPMIIGIPWGINGVASGYCIGNFFWVYPVIKTVFRELGLPFSCFITSIYRPILIATGTGVISLLSIFLCKLAQIDKIQALLFDIFSYLVAYLALTFIFNPTGYSRFLALFRPRRGAS